MRTKLNLGSSTDRRITGKLAISGGITGGVTGGVTRGVTGGVTRGVTRMTLSAMSVSGLPMRAIPASGIPMEWLDAGSWRLPSGKALAEFALQAGFLAPPLFKAEFKAEQFGGQRRR